MFVRNGRPCPVWNCSLLGHTLTGVTFDVENDRPGPGSLRGHFEAARGRFLRLRAGGCFAIGGPPQELAVKRLVYIYIYIYGIETYEE